MICNNCTCTTEAKKERSARQKSIDKHVKIMQEFNSGQPVNFGKSIMKICGYCKEYYNGFNFSCEECPLFWRNGIECYELQEYKDMEEQNDNVKLKTYTSWLKRLGLYEDVKKEVMFLGLPINHNEQCTEDQDKINQITTEQFDDELLDILVGEDFNIIITVPGVYELLAEHYNNQVIENILSKGN